MSARRNIALARRQRGVAALLIVGVLLLALALTAGRAQLRLQIDAAALARQVLHAQAFEAAEAGLAWAEDHLQRGRVDGTCRPSDDTTQLPLRERLLRSTSPQPSAACALGGLDWQCRCDGATPDAASARFRVALSPLSAREGVWRVTAVSCAAAAARVGDACEPGASSVSAAQARTQVLLAELPALYRRPQAALTAGGDVNLHAQRAVDTGHQRTALTVHAGGTVNAGAHSLVASAGTPVEITVAAGDKALADAARSATQFAYRFGVAAEQFAWLPRVTTVRCDGDCAPALAQAARQGEALLYVEGDARIEGPLQLGNVDAPVLLVVRGAVRLAGAVEIVGVLAARRLRWDGGSLARGRVLGATVIEEDCCDGAGLADFVHDPAVVKRVVSHSASWVRVPGSWKDF